MCGSVTFRLDRSHPSYGPCKWLQVLFHISQLSRLKNVLPKRVQGVVKDVLHVIFSTVQQKYALLTYFYLYFHALLRHNNLQLAIQTGFGQSSNSIYLNSQPAINVNILRCVNFGVAKLLTNFYFEVCPSFVDPLFDKHDVWLTYIA